MRLPESGLAVIEKVLTFHEITRSTTKAHEKGGLYWCYFVFFSCDFVDRRNS
jgi:hypothetical protein